MYVYGRFMLLYGKNHHNIVIILQLKERKLRSSLLAQRLEFQAFTAVAWFQSLVGKLPQTVQHGQKKEIKK